MKYLCVSDSKPKLLTSGAKNIGIFCPRWLWLLAVGLLNGSNIFGGRRKNRQFIDFLFAALSAGLRTDDEKVDIYFNVGLKIDRK